MKTHNLPQHQRARQSLMRNPIAAAYARQHTERTRTQADKEFQSQLLDTRIKMLSADHGSDATELLAALSVVIGTPCQCGMSQFGHLPWVGQLHGALRTIQAMCLAGYRWNSQYALALDRAVELASIERPELEPNAFTEAWVLANHMAALVLNHSIDAHTVADSVADRAAA